MSEMVERVARVLHDDWYPGLSAEDSAENWPEMRDMFMRSARAAIEAMRGPTKAMIDAGFFAYYQEDKFPGDAAMEDEDASRIFIAMIDTALKE